MVYEKAMAEVVELDNTDVITTSGETSSEWCGETNAYYDTCGSLGVAFGQPGEDDYFTCHKPGAGF